MTGGPNKRTANRPSSRMAVRPSTHLPFFLAAGAGAGAALGAGAGAALGTATGRYAGVATFAGEGTCLLNIRPERTPCITDKINSTNIPHPFLDAGAVAASATIAVMTSICFPLRYQTEFKWYSRSQCIDFARYPQMQNHTMPSKAALSETSTAPGDTPPAKGTTIATTRVVNRVWPRFRTAFFSMPVYFFFAGAGFTTGAEATTAPHASGVIFVLTLQLFPTF